MTPVIVGAALALLALDAAPAGTSAPPTTVKPAVVTAAAGKDDALADMDKVICKKEQITGSRFMKRTCMTKAQWGDQERDTEDFKRRVTQHVDAPMQGGLAAK